MAAVKAPHWLKPCSCGAMFSGKNTQENVFLLPEVLHAFQVPALREAVTIILYLLLYLFF